jgi:hypothetical protein
MHNVVFIRTPVQMSVPENDTISIAMQILKMKLNSKKKKLRTLFPSYKKNKVI